MRKLGVLKMFASFLAHFIDSSSIFIFSLKSNTEERQRFDILMVLLSDENTADKENIHDNITDWNDTSEVKEMLISWQLNWGQLLMEIWLQANCTLQNVENY